VPAKLSKQSKKRFHNALLLKSLKPKNNATLHSKQIKLHLQAIPNWSKRAQAIHRTFKFEGFLNGIDFVNRIAKKAQAMNHHPDIDVRFDQVTLTLTTHDEGGITEKDFLLAKQCDEVFSKITAS
jgi:4a-hydroxytetrahydrobiopterin dehydratase